MDPQIQIKTIKSWLGTGSINIFGPPFAGKDTHGRQLAKQLGAHLLGGGEIIRSRPVPAHIKSLHTGGRLIPSETYFELVLPYLKQAKFSGKPLVLSSVGRWQGEETAVLEAAASAGHPIKAAIYLTVEEPIIWDRWEHSDSRLNRGYREDDSREALQVRLKEFQTKTLPVIDAYRNRGLLIEIDSNRPKETVSRDILDALLRFSKI